ncbi:chaperone protein dnaJ 49 [Iris pallida]|uniref:Chaperone protein dnaJ 49 n=1 Tax=Iris pallida TaxID=29817 RepID=A0AAX6FL75_IRIPA|nr:chaperone protein dnaJ 49 [Iris pallida]
MDGNKDEAARCLKLAESALLSKDKQRALKFIRIAKRLDPAISTDELSAACRSPGSSSSFPQQRGSAREPPAVSSAAAERSGLDRGYTEEHVKSIREIRKSKDYYAILGVERSCSVEEIRKAYRKLSLKVHPDKNKAPGADEAFKIVSRAFKCLSEEEPRRRYDQTGVADGYEFDQLHSKARRRGRTTTRYYDFFEEDLDPEEIFRSFFYGGTQGDAFRSQRVYRTRMRTARQQKREKSVPVGGEFTWMILLQFTLIVFFFVIASIIFSEPHYSLQKAYAYQIPKLTEKHGVEYYVKALDFDHKFPKGSSARYELEDRVERDYSSALGRYCHVEMQRRRWVRDYPTPHCDKLRSFRVA